MLNALHKVSNVPSKHQELNNYGVYADITSIIVNKGAYLTAAWYGISEAVTDIKNNASTIFTGIAGMHIMVIFGINYFKNKAIGCKRIEVCISTKFGDNCHDRNDFTFASNGNKISDELHEVLGCELLEKDLEAEISTFCNHLFNSLILLLNKKEG